MARGEVSAWVGDRAATARFVEMLSARAEKLGLAILARPWSRMARLAGRVIPQPQLRCLMLRSARVSRDFQFDLHFDIPWLLC